MVILYKNENDKNEWGWTDIAWTHETNLSGLITHVAVNSPDKI